jgi:polypeptide N-acetylgalactosaminyltransferase
MQFQLIVSPVIDAINDTTFYYEFIEKDLKGLMNWQMVFEWQELTPVERQRKPNPWAPHPNPVMSGGLFSIDRDWFATLGFYDTGKE